MWLTSARFCSGIEMGEDQSEEENGCSTTSSHSRMSPLYVYFISVSNKRQPLLDPVIGESAISDLCFPYDWDPCFMCSSKFCMLHSAYSDLMSFSSERLDNDLRSCNLSCLCNREKERVTYKCLTVVVE